MQSWARFRTAGALAACAYAVHSLRYALAYGSHAGTELQRQGHAYLAGAPVLLTALLAVGAALLVGHLVDLVLPRPRIAAGVPRGLLGLVLAVVAAAAAWRFAPSTCCSAVPTSSRAAWTFWLAASTSLCEVSIRERATSTSCPVMRPASLSWMAL
jgi:hypothetical protein